MRKKPYLFKRVIAYIIDLIIVTLLSGIIALVVTNTESSDMQTSRLFDLTKRMASGEITSEEYYEKFDEINYDVTKESISVTAINCIVTLVYFVVMCYYCHGITLGKYLMKIKIKSAKDKELNLGNYLLRSLIVNMLLTNLVSILLVSILSKESFTSIYPRMSNLFTVLIIISFIVMIYREDGRGLHDLVGGTVVVDFKKNDNEEDMKEAQILEEKEVVKEKKKSKK